MGERTDIDMACRVKDILKSWGKAPVLVKKDLPGQLANRIYQVVIREAVQTVSMGLADAQDVDMDAVTGRRNRYLMRAVQLLKKYDETI